MEPGRDASLESAMTRVIFHEAKKQTPPCPARWRLFRQTLCYFFLRRRAAIAAAPAPMANTRSEAGSGTDVGPPPPGAGGHIDGTILQVWPACAGVAPSETTAIIASRTQSVFFMCLPFITVPQAAAKAAPADVIT